MILQRAREGGHGERVHGMRDTNLEQSVVELLRRLARRVDLAQVMRDEPGVDVVVWNSQNEERQGVYKGVAAEDCDCLEGVEKADVGWTVHILDSRKECITPVPAVNVRKSDSEDGSFIVFMRQIDEKGSRGTPEMQAERLFDSSRCGEGTECSGSKTRPHTIRRCSVRARRGRVQRDSAAHANPTGNMPASLRVRHRDVSRPGRVDPQTLLTSAAGRETRPRTFCTGMSGPATQAENTERMTK
ncbi:hypothetical protein FB451DRAFT_1191262 [Mycena latifolia]|nr:hypothetical protein FB451DRAFT_1191262 [Mycena latifolia]